MLYLYWSTSVSFESRTLQVSNNTCAVDSSTGGDDTLSILPAGIMDNTFTPAPPAVAEHRSVSLNSTALAGCHVFHPLRGWHTSVVGRSGFFEDMYTSSK